MKINVFGSEISSLVCAACLAETGNFVTLIGTADLASTEPGLVRLLKAQVAAERLIYSDTLNPEANVHIIASNPDECSKGKEYAQLLANYVTPKSCLIIRSNFSLGTPRKIGELAKMPWLVNPDFAPEGQAISGFLRPDRLIIGSENEYAIEVFKRLFAPFNRNRDVTILMSPESAELTKYATNAMLATRISLMNDLAQAAEYLHADIEEVRQGLGADSRIGFSYLYPGIGFGGNHFERDLSRAQTLIQSAGSHSSLLQSVLDINKQQKEVLFRKLWQHFDCHLEGKTVTLWGISYKPNSNSIENAPSLVLIKAFLAQGCRLNVFDPKLDENFTQWMLRELTEEQRACVHIFDNMYTATEQADALCVVTEWKPFWLPDMSILSTNMRTKIILDGRNLYQKPWIKSYGFDYYGIGR
jgi:UDPglucose 6-dehydrogenase